MKVKSKINGFKKINLNNPRNIKKINLNDRIIYFPKKNNKIDALVVEKGNISFSTAYRTKNKQGQEKINIDICCIDPDSKKIKPFLYQELYKDYPETSGHYKYLNKILNQSGI